MKRIKFLLLISSQLTYKNIQTSGFTSYLTTQKFWMYQIQIFEIRPEPDVAGYPLANLAGIGTG